MEKTTSRDVNWNTVRGCSRVSEGCSHCYAERLAGRFCRPGLPYHGLAAIKNGESRWTGEISFVEKHVPDPIKWKAPAKIFVNSMSDLFHPAVKDEWLAAIFDVMGRAPQHTYLILTKRPERMRDVLAAAADPAVARAFEKTYSQPWPPPNWWFGVSIEDQKTADQRLPILAECIAAIRWVSYEPALGPVDWLGMHGPPWMDWLVVGGESGAEARPMHPMWARAARDICRSIQIPFFFKGWGEWRPLRGAIGVPGGDLARYEDGTDFVRVGKSRSGSSLDGVEWKEFPQCS